MFDLLPISPKQVVLTNKTWPNVKRAVLVLWMVCKIKESPSYSLGKLLSIFQNFGVLQVYQWSWMRIAKSHTYILF